MATRRRSSRGSSGGKGGVKGIASAGIMILLLAAAALGWWNYNGFKDVGDALDWFQNKSANMNDCVDGELVKEGSQVKNIWNAHGCIIPHLGGEGSGSTTGTTPGNSAIVLTDDAKTATLAALAAIPVAPSQDVDYERSEWKHWLDLNDDGCDTREADLVANGTDVKTDPKTCKVLSGTWVEQYAGKTYTDPSGMDLDHVVPLSWAAANGGNEWDSEKKSAFANDPANLYLADASENRKKGDKGPGSYLPPNESFQCNYVNSFVLVVSSYGLTIPQLDKTAAEKVINERC